MIDFAKRFVSTRKELTDNICIMFIFIGRSLYSKRCQLTSETFSNKVREIYVLTINFPDSSWLIIELIVLHFYTWQSSIICVCYSCFYRCQRAVNYSDNRSLIPGIDYQMIYPTNRFSIKLMFLYMSMLNRHYSAYDICRLKIYEVPYYILLSDGLHTRSASLALKLKKTCLSNIRKFSTVRENY